jgi:hypothetical protein
MILIYQQSSQPHEILKHAIFTDNPIVFTQHHHHIYNCIWKLTPTLFLLLVLGEYKTCGYQVGN